MKFCRWTLFKIYDEFKDLFDGNKHGFDSESVSQNRREVSCWGLHGENQSRFSKSKHFRFYWTKKHFISEWNFAKNHEIWSLVARKVKK